MKIQQQAQKHQTLGGTFACIAGALLAASFLCSEASDAQSIVNGDFESGTDGFVVFPGYVGSNDGSANPAEIPGWIGQGWRGINPVVPGGPDAFQLLRTPH